MYITRVFLVCYQIIINYQIESGGDVREIIISGLVAMVFAVLANLLIFTRSSILKFSWNIYYKTFTQLKLVNHNEYCSDVHLLSAKINFNSITFASIFSTISLLLVYIMPQIFATIFFDYRLTLSSVGQVISFAGMVITLFILDPQLFKMQDDGEIKVGFSYYLHGRILGLTVAAIILAISILIIESK
jgi:hypothetical protein